MTYNIMLLAASTIRSVITASPGKKLVIADLANIEGRGLAWLAGEEWKLQAFRDFDTFVLDLANNKIPDGKGGFERLGPDLYKLAYAKAFGISPSDVSKFGRSVGKVMELGLGFAGGISAFVTFALVYGIDLDEMADAAWDTLPADILLEAEDFIEWMESKGRTFPISHRAALVCEVFKRLWRNAHPMTVKLWAELKEGFVSATERPGVTFEYRGFKFRRDGAWLRIRLPSGRFLCYPNPQVDDSGQCSYMGVNQFTRKWERIKTHGGKLAENADQSLSRDVLFDRMPMVEAAGYEITIRVHDELVTEAPDTAEYSSDKLVELLAVAPDWAKGFPVAAAGFESYRYRKD